MWTEGDWDDVCSPSSFALCEACILRIHTHQRAICVAIYAKTVKKLKLWDADIVLDLVSIFRLNIAWVINVEGIDEVGPSVLFDFKLTTDRRVLVYGLDVVGHTVVDSVH